MNTRFNFSPIAYALAIVATSIALAPVSAAAQERSPWQVKGHAAIVGTDNTFSVGDSNGGRTEAGSNTQFGQGIAVEYRLNHLIGFELGASTAKTPDIEGSDNGNKFDFGDGPRFSPISLGVNFHLLDSNRFDVFVGPRIAFVKFGGFELESNGQRSSYEVDDEIAWGATAGMAYHFGNSGWSLIGELTYLNVDMDVTERGSGQTTTVSLDPITLGIGAAYRF